MRSCSHKYRQRRTALLAGCSSRSGQVFVVVIILVALVMSGLAVALTTTVRSTAMSSAASLKSVQALYLAEMGINDGIYRINTEPTFVNGQFLDGSDVAATGTWHVVYHKPDTYGTGGGDACFESTGTAGGVSRTVYQSIVPGAAEAFKYCLFTDRGGNLGLSQLTNVSYGAPYRSNATAATVPVPNWGSYAAAYPNTKTVSIHNNKDIVTLDSSYNGYAVLLSGGKDSWSCTVVLPSSLSPFSCSIILYPHISDLTVSASFGSVGNTLTWTPYVSPTGTWPLVVSDASVTLAVAPTNRQCTLAPQGLIYSSGSVQTSASGQDRIEITGEVMAASASVDIGPNPGSTSITYGPDFYRTPPPFFSGSGLTVVKKGTWREGY